MNKKILSALTIAIVSLSLLTLVQATMNNTNANPIEAIFLTLEGETQGTIDGGSTEAGREGQIEIIGYSHAIVSPRDAASGLPTGKRQHKPLTITKEVDKSSPLLMNLLCYNERTTTFLLEFCTIVDSAESIFFTIELLDASVALISSEMRQGVNIEVVSFCYSKIIWTWVDGGITAEDDWETPVV